MYENGHRRSHVPPPPPPAIIGSFCPPEILHTSDFNQSKPKFSHMTFDWNSSSEFKNGHQGQMQPLLIGVFRLPENSILFFLSVTLITLERLNQSEPNFHTRLLTEIARPCTKMDIAGHM